MDSVTIRAEQASEKAAAAVIDLQLLETTAEAKVEQLVAISAANSALKSKAEQGASSLDQEEIRNIENEEARVSAMVLTIAKEEAKIRAEEAEEAARYNSNEEETAAAIRAEEAEIEKEMAEQRQDKTDKLLKRSGTSY